MSAVVLYHSGKESIDPKTHLGYDPWKSHILDGIKQLRVWNPQIPIYLIVDEDINAHEKILEELHINIIKTKNIKLERNLIFLNDYFLEQKNNLWKTSFMRFFYIEQVIKNNNLTDVFTYDNDVLIYFDMEKQNKAFQKFCGEIGITRIDQNGLICGMMWFRNKNSITKLNDIMSKLVENDNKNVPECNLLHKAWLTKGDSLLTPIPIWYFGSYSKNWQEHGGIYDPATIGQFMGGCHNGSPPKTIMIHHEIGTRLKQFMDSGGEIKKLFDINGRIFYGLFHSNKYICKLNSIHMHNKKLKDFMNV